MIIGLGTGICGTRSLSKVLGLSHEKIANISWELDREKFERAYHKLTKNDREPKGDVAFYWLPYIGWFLEKDSSIKFICLQRDKIDTVTAFYNKFILNPVPQHRWVDHKKVPGQWYPHPRYDKYYPNYPANLSPREAIIRYYDDYYEVAKWWECSFPNNFRIFKTEIVLNSMEEQQKMLDFCNLDQPVNLGVRLNAKGYSKQPKV